MRREAVKGRGLKGAARGAVAGVELRSDARASTGTAASVKPEAEVGIANGQSGGD